MALRDLCVWGGEGVPLQMFEKNPTKGDIFDYRLRQVPPRPVRVTWPRAPAGPGPRLSRRAMRARATFDRVPF
jgi:hypothetical protein